MPLPPEADHIAVHARPRPDVRERIPHGRELGTLTGRALAGASLGKPGLGCDERRRHEAGGAGHGECQEEGCKEAHGAWRSGQESIEVKGMEITARGRQGGDPRHETGDRMHNRANLRWLWCVWWVVCWIVVPCRFLLCVDSLKEKLPNCNCLRPGGEKSPSHRGKPAHQWQQHASRQGMKRAEVLAFVAGVMTVAGVMRWGQADG